MGCADDVTSLPIVTLEGEYSLAYPLEGDLKFMSFNILAEIWEGTGFEEKRNKKIVATIKEKDPDILLLQEAQDSSVNFILEQLKEYTKVSFPSNDHSCWDDWLGDRCWAPNGQAVLAKTHVVNSVCRVETLNIAEEGKPAFRVPAVTLKMQTPPAEDSRTHTKRVCIVNVHLWYGSNGGIRKMQLNKIKRYLAQQQKEGKIDYIMLAGDFNDITGSLLREQRNEFVNHGDLWGLQHVDTCANGWFSLRIDHIISSKQVKSTHMETPYENEGWGLGVLGGSRNRHQSLLRGAIDRGKIIAKYGSDHLPVTGTFHVEHTDTVPLALVAQPRP